MKRYTREALLQIFEGADRHNIDFTEKMRRDALENPLNQNRLRELYRQL